MFRTVRASILLLCRCFGSVSPSHSYHWFSIGFSLVFRMVLASILLALLWWRSALFWLVFRTVWASILLLFRCFGSVSPGHSFHWFSIGFSLVFRMVLASIGLNPSSSIMRSVGDVRQFSGSCFVRFGHQSCCCSAVSEAFLQVIPSIGFLSAFRSGFAWFWASIGLNPSSSLMRSVGDVSYGLGINPAAVPLFRKRFSRSFLPLVFYRLFARVSHGFGLNWPQSFYSSIMRSVGDVRHFSGSCFVRFGHQSCCCSAVSEAFLQVIPSIGFLSAFRSCFAWFWASIGLNPSSSIMRSVGDVRHFSGSCFVRFGHQSCCCSAVSEAFLQVIPSIGFLSAFRSCFAWFWPQLASILLALLCVPSVTFGTFLVRVSYGLGINPAAVPLFRKRFSRSFHPLVFYRLFARVSHGFGPQLASILLALLCVP